MFGYTMSVWHFGSCTPPLLNYYRNYLLLIVDESCENTKITDMLVRLSTPSDLLHDMQTLHTSFYERYSDMGKLLGTTFSGLQQMQ